MTTDERGSDADSGGVADKDDLQRAVEQRVAEVEEAAGSEPVVNAADPEQSSADNSTTANPVAAPAPIAEPGDVAAPSAPQPGPPSRDPAQPNTPRVTDEGDE